MLAHHPRWWTNSNPTLVQRRMFAGNGLCTMYATAYLTAYLALQISTIPANTKHVYSIYTTSPDGV